MTRPPSIDSGAPRIAILGAGPVGLDSALAAQEQGLDFTIFEQAREVGANVRAWGHVRLFSPWSMNASERMRGALGGAVPDSDLCPTGQELVDVLLEPLAGLESISSNLRYGHRVVAVSREGLVKSDEIGTGRRADRPFRILVEDPTGKEYVHQADVVIDCTGTYHNPNPTGDGGIPAPGERELGGRIVRAIPGPDQWRAWKGKDVLVVGAGHSAQTAVRDLTDAFQGDGRVIWAIRDQAPAFRPEPGDPLPVRAELLERVGELVGGADAGVELNSGSVVQSLEEHDGRVRVLLRAGDGVERQITVDHVVSLTGSVGDADLYRQLQVHECYATSGLMNLSAALLGESSADCLAQTTHGADTLKSPEPNFFVLGAKSYGRTSTFLLRVGYAQVGEVFALLRTPAFALDGPG